MRTSSFENVDTFISDEIKRLIQRLERFDAESDEYSKITDQIVKLKNVCDTEKTK